MLKQVRYFQAVVHYQSFTEAAAACFISQSAISQQIQALERELGVTLLIREKRQFHLTPAGKYFYEHSLLIVHDLDQLIDETIRLDRGQEHDLTVGCLPYDTTDAIQQILPSYHQMYPDIRIHLRHGSHEDLYRMMQNREADLILNDIRRQPSQQYVNYFLTRRTVFAAVPQDSPLADLAELDVEQLKRTPCIIVSTPGQEQVEKDFYQTYVGIASPFLVTDNWDEAQLMMLSRRGFLPVDLEETPPQSASIAYLPLLHQGTHITRDYYAFWPVSCDAPHIRAFAKLLHQHASSRPDDTK